jgi:hypothetical protein
MGSSSDGFVVGDRSPEYKGGAVWKLERCPGKGTFKFLVLSSKPLMVGTHFVSRSGKPCRAVDCPHCANHVEQRWNGYLAIAMLPNKVKCLVEYTEGSQAPLIEAFERFGTIRGLQVIMSRPRGRFNSPMLLQCPGRQENTFDLPEEPDVFAEMCRIWKVNQEVAPVVPSTRRQRMHQAEKESKDNLARSTIKRGRIDLTDEEKRMSAIGREKVDAHPLKDILDVSKNGSKIH